MALTFDYRNSSLDEVVQVELLRRSEYQASREANFKSTAYWSCVLLLAIYASVRAESIALVCMFAAVLLIMLYQSIRYAHNYWLAVEAWLDSQSGRQIHLEARDDGLHETVEGIESFVPWSSVRSFTLFRDRLFIELAARLWAVVPRHSLAAGSNSIDDLVRVLKENGIEETPESSRQ